MSEAKFVAVVTTIGNREEAEAMARALVERRLAACAQISQIESFYRWEGAVQNDSEFRILFKTRQSRYADAESAIRELHSYDLPAIHAIALDEIYAPYGKWVEACTSA